MVESIIASEKVKKERLDICSACENNKMNICMKCGCLLGLKTQWKSTKCPIGKWGPVSS